MSLAGAAAAQDCSNAVRAYVHPHTGWDPPLGNLQDALRRLDNQRTPFKTIQRAIDVCQLGVADQFLNGGDGPGGNPPNPDAFGIVFCLPGIYGPGGQSAGEVAGDWDELPIRMRDRVSVQGQGARRTLIRGINDQNQESLLPTLEPCGTVSNVEVLVTFESEHSQAADVFGAALPWAAPGENSEEMFDGFTLQSGDFQVLVDSEFAGARARISNCIFDMRNHSDDMPNPLTGQALDGPYFGIAIRHVYDLQAQTYFPHTPNILNNTFILGEADVFSAGSGGPCPALSCARDEAVAIIDFNNPQCDAVGGGGGGDPGEEEEPGQGQGGTGGGDVNQEFRGVGDPNIQNNLIRTLPIQDMLVTEFLGIDSTDTEVDVGGGTRFGPTNAFDSTRVGIQNAMFTSTILPGQSLPTPRVDTLTNDPGFVGEITALLIGNTISNPSQRRDWRIMPDSTMVDEGSRPTPTTVVLGRPDVGAVLRAVNQTEYVEPDCGQISSYDFDGEIYGNRRMINEVDIGADEFHLTVQAGNWADDSNSHNFPAPLFNADITETGLPLRWFVFPDDPDIVGFAVLGSTFRPIVFAAAPGPVTLPGWIRPFGTVAATLEPNRPVGFNERYIRYQNGLLRYPFDSTCVGIDQPLPWLGGRQSFSAANPVTGQLHQMAWLTDINFPSFPPQDNEGSVIPGCPPPLESYFNMQVEVLLTSGDRLLTNMQAEYR